MSERLGMGRRAPTPRARARQPGAAQDLADGALRGTGLVGMLAQQQRSNLRRAPQAMGVAQLEDASDHVEGSLVGVMVGRPRTILESGGSLALIALGPLVAHRAGDTVAAAEFGLGFEAVLPFDEELHALVHGVVFFPGHKNIFAC